MPPRLNHRNPTNAQIFKSVIPTIIVISYLFNQPFGITWRKALLSAPRLVPNQILYITSPEGPHPFIIDIPSRGNHEIPLYVFVPASPRPAKLPVLLDFHGGGFIFGSCQEQAPFCAKMARELNAVCISVDYRLGPAAQFPAAIEDAEDVVKAVLDPGSRSYMELRKKINGFQFKISRSQIEFDESRVAVSGFSSGGNLALNLGLNVREHEWPSIFPSSFVRNIPLLLFFPLLDCRQFPNERPRPPGMEKKKGYLKGLELDSTIMPTYLPREQAGHPRASPGLASIAHGGLHTKVKMLLVLPEIDTLASQSDVWIEKVEKGGRSGDLSVEKVKGVVHGWTQFPDSWLSQDHRDLKMKMFNRARNFTAMAWSTE